MHLLYLASGLDQKGVFVDDLQNLAAVFPLLVAERVLFWLVLPQLILLVQAFIITVLLGTIGHGSDAPVGFLIVF